MLNSRHSLDDLSVMREKVEQDIAFLADKIDRMMHQAKPNEVLISHYTTMLRSRQAVLNWIMDGEVVEQTNKIVNI